MCSQSTCLTSVLLVIGNCSNWKIARYVFISSNLWSTEATQNCCILHKRWSLIMCKSVWTNCYCHPTLPCAHWVTGNKWRWRCARKAVVLHGGRSGRGLGKGECPIHHYSPTTFVPTLPVSFTGMCVNRDRWHQVEDCVDMLEFKGDYSLLMKAWWSGWCSLAAVVNAVD